MSDREPALLVVLIDTSLLRWHVGGIAASCQPFPLLRSEEGNLDEYRGLEFDEQISFLRHRLAGVLQRGCDRLFARQMKASHFLLIADGLYPDAAEGISKRLAEHFVEWMMNPPATYLLAPPGFAADRPSEFQVIAGEFPESIAAELGNGLPQLVADIQQPQEWELIVRPQRH